MSEIVFFLDSSVLIAGIISSQGASRTLLLLGEDKKVVIAVSEQVIAEVERNIARKAPKALPFVREILTRINVRIFHDPSVEIVQKHLDWIQHVVDVPILITAVQADVDFLVTLNKRHFIDEPKIAEVSDLRIGTPGDALTWVRDQLV